jgi:hypothetical protein
MNRRSLEVYLPRGYWGTDRGAAKQGFYKLPVAVPTPQITTVAMPGRAGERKELATEQHKEQI